MGSASICLRRSRKVSGQHDVISWLMLICYRGRVRVFGCKKSVMGRVQDYRKVKPHWVPDFRKALVQNALDVKMTSPYDGPVSRP